MGRESRDRRGGLGNQSGTQYIRCLKASHPWNREGKTEETPIGSVDCCVVLVVRWVPGSVEIVDDQPVISTEHSSPLPRAPGDGALGRRGGALAQRSARFGGVLGVLRLSSWSGRGNSENEIPHVDVALVDERGYTV